MRRIGRFIVGLAGAALGSSLSSPEVLAQGCAMCRMAVQSPDDPLVKGINLSVVLMVAMPFAVVGGIGGWVVMAYRRAPSRAPFSGGASPGLSAPGTEISATTEEQP